jgi:hypothetical protein
MVEDLSELESGSHATPKLHGASMFINDLYMMCTLVSLTIREKLLIEATQLHLVSEVARFISMVNEPTERESLS